MPARKKGFLDFVRDGTFLARRHEHYLEDERLAADATLARIQKAYRAETSDLRRRELALEFQRACRAGVADRRELARSSIEKAIAELGPAGSAERVINFFPRFLRLENGKPFRLESFQESFVRDFWRRDRRRRRIYKVGLLGLPRGCGKTPLASGLAVCAMVTEEQRPRVFQVAGSREQASIGTEFAEAWAEDGELAEILVSSSQRISCTLNRGQYRVLSSDGRLAAGRRPRAGVVDEWWLFASYRERQTYTQLATALHKIQDAWLLPISTAGYDESSQLGETFQAALEGPGVEISKDGCLTIVRDPASGFLMHWYGAPEDADIENPAILRACNPASWVDVEELLRELRRPDTEVDEWRRLHANQWVRHKGAWIPKAALDALAGETEIPAGGRIVIGMDGALNYDTTAVVWAWRSPSGRVVLKGRVWSVRDDAAAHDRVPGDRLDNEALVEPLVYELAKRYKVQAVVCDRRYLHTEAKHLSDRGLTVVELEHHSAAMYDATQAFYDDITAGRIEAGDDPVLREHYKATAGQRTESGWRIYKLKSSRPIDATSASVMANYGLGLVPETPFVGRLPARQAATERS